MTAVLYLLLLFLQQGSSEETMLKPNNETSLVKNITTSEETSLVNIRSEDTSLVNITTCEKLAEICTYTLPRIPEKEQGYDQCQVTFHNLRQIGLILVHPCQGQESAGERRLLCCEQFACYSRWNLHQPLQPGCLCIHLFCVSATRRQQEQRKQQQRQ